MTKSKLTFILLTAFAAKLIQENVKLYGSREVARRESMLNYERYLAVADRFNAALQFVPSELRPIVVGEMEAHDKFLNNLYN